MPFVLPFPDIDPVLFSVHLFGLELAIRWYALAYIAGLLLGWRYVVLLCRRPALWGGRRAAARRAGRRPADLDDPRRRPRRPPRLRALLPAGLLRREPGADPRGLAGRHVVPRRLARRRRRRRSASRCATACRSSAVGDAVAAAAPIGLFFGRIANFINAELWGRPSTAPWAVIFPGEAAQTCPADWAGALRAPPVAALRGGARGARCSSLLLALAIRAGALRAAGAGLRAVPRSATGWRGSSSSTSARPTRSSSRPDNPHGHVLRLGGEWGLTMGQLLSLPMLAVGLLLVLRRARLARGGHDARSGRA